MRAHSRYIIEDKNGPWKLTIVDEDPQGVTINISSRDGSPSNEFNLPRIQMIEALEYIVKKLKTTIV